MKMSKRNVTNAKAKAEKKQSRKPVVSKHALKVRKQYV